MPPRWVPQSTFGSRLALVRNQKGWNVTQAARQAGLDPQSWRNWEGGMKPRALDDVVGAVSAASGCDPVWLMFGDQEPPASSNEVAS